MGFPSEPRDGSVDLVPISTSYVPNVGFVAIQGSPTINTDSAGNVSSPVDLNLKQIGDTVIALGQALKAASIPVAIASDQIVPVSATSLPLPTGAATQTTLASVLAQLQAGIAVNTISNYANETGGNLALAKADLDTLAGIVSGGKGAVRAGAGDFADLATLLALAGASGDANSVNSFMGRLTKIRDLLNSTLGIQQTDLTATGTISAAQPVIGTPVTNATLTLAVGQGQSSWKAQLLAGGGGFTSSTTIVADGSADGGTTWYSKSFKVSGASPATGQSSVVGPGPIELSGNASGLTHVRIRCSILNSTETINVILRGSAGIGDIGILSPLPAGQNLVGYVEDIEQQGYIALTSPPSTTNAGSDTVLTFSSQVNRIIIQNNTSANANFDFDQSASAGSFLVVPGGMIVYPKKCTAFHLFTAAAQNINGTSAGNIVVRGAM